MDDKEFNKIFFSIIGDGKSEIVRQLKEVTDYLFCFYTSAINSGFSKNQAIYLTNSMLTTLLTPKGEGK